MNCFLSINKFKLHCDECFFNNMDIYAFIAIASCSLIQDKHSLMFYTLLWGLACWSCRITLYSCSDSCAHCTVVSHVAKIVLWVLCGCRNTDLVASSQRCLNNEPIENRGVASTWLVKIHLSSFCQGSLENCENTELQWKSTSVSSMSSIKKSGEKKKYFRWQTKGNRQHCKILFFIRVYQKRIVKNSCPLTGFKYGSINIYLYFMNNLIN